MLWLCDSWKDSHELTVILGDDVLLKVLSFSVNALKDLHWLLLLSIILGCCLLLVEVISLSFSFCIIVQVLKIEYVIRVVQEVLRSARLLGGAWVVGSQLIGVVIKRCVV